MSVEIQCRFQKHQWAYLILRKRKRLGVAAAAFTSNSTEEKQQTLGIEIYMNTRLVVNDNFIHGIPSRYII